MYIEGYNFAEDHLDSEFFNLLGCDFIEDGNNVNDIWNLRGARDSFTEDKYYDYGLAISSRCRPDVISAGNGFLLFESQDSLGYAVALNNGSYKVITSSFLLGALIDGENGNTKIELMNKYLDFFEGTLSVRDLTSVVKSPSGFELSQNYPNPFTHTTLINFKLLDKTDQWSLSVFNMLGQEVAKLNNLSGKNDIYSTTWDGKNNHEELLPSGTYIYRLKVGDRTMNRKMSLVR